jgi:hypothetical protein
VIQIDDPPTLRACISCMSPIAWRWNPTTGTWMAYAMVPGDTELLRVHKCPIYGAPKSWRHVDRQPPEVLQRGLARVRAVLNQGETP